MRGLLVNQGDLTRDKTYLTNELKRVMEQMDAERESLMEKYRAMEVKADG